MHSTASPRPRLLRSALTALFVAGTLGLGAGCNSDADQGDTSPRSGEVDGPTGDKPGATPGGQTNPAGEGEGTGRGDETP